MINKVVDIAGQIISRQWGHFYSLRRKLYRHNLLTSHSYDIPVISVGNLTFGGTGKTPVVMSICSYLNSIGYRVAVLTRGYRGQMEKVGGVITDSDAVYKSGIEYGDEPVMIAQVLKGGGVIVGGSRHENLQRFADEVRPDIIILDDGYQHLKIDRNLNIVIFDATLELSHYSAPPVGYARETLESVGDADLILVSKVDQASPEQLSKLAKVLDHSARDVPRVEFTYSVSGFYNYRGESLFSRFNLVKSDSDKDTTQPLSVIALAAIASPQSFFLTLENSGLAITEKHTFLDHYNYKLKDLEPMIRKAESLATPIICTEKDMVKIMQIVKSPLIFYPKLTVDFRGQDSILHKHICSIISYGK